MNEVYIITMNWWQLALFTIGIALCGAMLYELLPRILKRFLDKMEGKKENKKDDEIIGVNTAFLIRGEYHKIKCPYCDSNVWLGGFPVQKIKLTDKI